MMSTLGLLGRVYAEQHFIVTYLPRSDANLNYELVIIYLIFSLGE